MIIQVLLNGLMTGGMYALVASGFTLILGVIQVFNFAQGQFYMLGAYTTFAMATVLGYPYIVGVIAAMIAMGILGILFHLGVIQWVMPYGFFHTLLVTLVFGTILNQVSMISFGNINAGVSPVIPGNFVFGDTIIPYGKLLVIGCAIVVMVALYYFMKTKIGTAMMAAAENRDIAGLQGINSKQIFLVTMAIGCILCGAAGAFIAPTMAISTEVGDPIFIRALMVVIIGGMGSMTGALLAALLVGVMESVAFQYLGSLNLIVIFVFMAVLTYFRPGGLLGKPLPVPGQ